MIRHSIPKVLGDHVILSESVNQSFPAIEVGSEAWYAWQPTDSFLPEALTLLERLLEDAKPKARMRSVIEILLLRAQALEAQGDHAGTFTSLGRALALAEPEGYIRLFLDEGAPMVALLRQAYVRQVTPGYVVTLLEAAGEQVMEVLTAREREVLRPTARSPITSSSASTPRKNTSSISVASSTCRAAHRPLPKFEH